MQSQVLHSLVMNTYCNIFAYGIRHFPLLKKKNAITSVAFVCDDHFTDAITSVAFVCDDQSIERIPLHYFRRGNRNADHHNFGPS